MPSWTWTKGLTNHILTTWHEGYQFLFRIVDLASASPLLRNLGKAFGYSSVMYYATIMELTQLTMKQRPWMVRLATHSQHHHSSVIFLDYGLDYSCSEISFRADFSLFCTKSTHNAGALYSVTNVIDVYYKGLTKSGDIGMTAAAGLYQSVVGFGSCLISNIIARRIDKRPLSSRKEDRMKKSTIQKKKLIMSGSILSVKNNFFFTLLVTLVGLTCVLPFIFVVLISLKRTKFGSPWIPILASKIWIWWLPFLGTVQS